MIADKSPQQAVPSYTRICDFLIMAITGHPDDSTIDAYQVLSSAQKQCSFLLITGQARCSCIRTVVHNGDDCQ
jgi:hypothetical protein